MKYILIASFLILLSSCNKPDPNPELKDPIYNDLQARLTTNNQSLEAEKQKYEGLEVELNGVLPQSGQNKNTLRKLYQSKAIIVRYEQEKQYLELKIESRRKSAVKDYLQAFYAKKPWPNPEEEKEYRKIQKMRSINPTWNVKSRMMEAGINPNPTSKAPEHSSEKEAKSE